MFFPDGKGDGEYYLRGGICFPTSYEQHGTIRVMGYAVLGGYNVNTKKLFILEQKDFLVIDSILEQDSDNKKIHKVVHEGLAQWLNNNWSKYFCKSYYWCQEEYVKNQYLWAVRRSDMVNPKPSFIEVDFADKKNIYHLLWRNIKLGADNFLGPKNSILKEQIELIGTDNKDAPPAVHALLCLLAGIERRPWIKRKE